MARKAIGIDFGTSTIKMYKNQAGILMNEKNVIAIQNKSHVLAVGDEAYEMYEKSPEEILVTYPIQNGVIADIKHMQMMVEFLLQQYKEELGNLKGSDYYLAVPTGITELEKKAYYDLIQESHVKAHKIYLIEKPVANLAGMDHSLLESKGVMVMDMGATTTEISILSLGGIVVSKLLPVGGGKLDLAIQKMIKNRYQHMIGEKTAEAIKIELAHAEGKTEIKELRTFGRNLETGLPEYFTIESEYVNRSVSEFFHFLVDAVRMIIERTPPEISGAVLQNGIYVTGGASRMKGLEDLLKANSSMPVHMCTNAESTVIQGLGAMIEHPKDYKGDWTWEEKRR